MEKNRHSSATRSRTVDMTQGNVLRHILTFAIPIFIGSVFQQIYSVVDTMVAGHVLGDVFIAAQTASDRFFMLLMGPITTLVEATGTFVGQNIGAGRRDRVREAIAKALLVETALGVLVILRTSMQAMGQKIAPVISSVTELFLRFLGGIWMIPAFGYAGGAWNTPVTWCTMTAFIFSVYWFRTRKALREEN